MEKRRTVTSPEPPGGSWFEGHDPVTALRAWSRSIGNDEYELELGRASFECGAHPKCHVVIDDPHVSARHALLERRSSRLRVIDLDTKNGIRLNGKREPSFDVGPGQVFGLAHSVTVLPMNEAMRTGRLRFVEVLGSEQPELTPDALLIEALGSGNLVVVGERGCGHDVLARAVHAVSIRRTLAPLEIDEIPADKTKQLEIATLATRSTLILKLRAETTKPSRAFLELITSAQYQIRVIALAPTLDVATRVLGIEIVGRMRPVLLRPLRMRVTELPQIFDQMLVARASTLRMQNLHAEHQAALCSYAWPKNLEELTNAVTRIAALVPSPTHIVPVKTAATALGIKESWFYDWLAKMSLSQFWESLTPEPAAPARRVR